MRKGKRLMTVGIVADVVALVALAMACRTCKLTTIVIRLGCLIMVTRNDSIYTSIVGSTRVSVTTRALNITSTTSTTAIVTSIATLPRCLVIICYSCTSICHFVRFDDYY